MENLMNCLAVAGFAASFWILVLIAGYLRQIVNELKELNGKKASAGTPSGHYRR